ncbi:DYNC1I2, partial [Symbiodinium sp. CCMP2456]
ERKKVESHPDYRAFFERATLLVERVLGQETWDLALDFKNTSAEGVEGEGGGADALKHVDDYVEDKWSRGRPVTDLRFSPHNKEIFIAAYHQKSNPELSDPDGCMLVWNLSMKSRPEVVFSAPSAVLTAIPHKFDPALLYGGTYSGGIVLWDTRQKAGPVLKTPLSGKGHAHPVTAMEQVGTQNATNLVTASNDGRLCVWSLAMLNQPQETVDLKHESKGRREPSVMSLSFPENETNVLYVGSEDGAMWQVNLRGTKTGITELYDGHDGPVTGVHMHPHQGNDSGISADTTTDLCLTSSFDWSIKLWRVKQFQSPVLSLDTFEDYVYDVRWHPTHPAVFASTDGEGHIDLWNLNKNIELPVLRCENPNGRRLALNKCHWSNDGRKLAAGDSEGTVSVFAADRTVAQPRNEDFLQFQERVRQLKPIVQRTRDSGYGDARLAAMAKGLAH